MKDVVLSIFGAYAPLMQPDGSTYVLGVAGVDWVWIAGIILFSVVLFSFFKLVGVLLKK